MNFQSTKCRGLETIWIEEGPRHAKLALIFLHGFPDNALVWKNQIHHFKKKFLVLAPFLRGASPSAPSSKISRYGFISQSLDLLSILKKYSEKEFILIGHDLGTLIAWYASPLLGKKLKGTLLINGITPALFFRRGLKQWRKSWYMPLLSLPPFAKLLLKGSGGKWISDARQRGGNSNPESVTNFTDTAKSYAAYSLDLFKSPSLLNNSQRLDTPLLVISSLQDEFVIPATLAEVKTLSQKPEARIIPAGHWIMEEKPDELNRLIENFITTNT